MAETKKKSTSKKSSTTKRTPSVKTVVKKQTKKAIKNASKTSGGRAVLFILLILIIIAGLVAVLVPIKDGKTLLQLFTEAREEPSSSLVVSSSRNSSENKPSSSKSSHSTSYSYISNDSEFNIYFLELGNWNTGDCVFIKAGNVDILIDAGSKYNSIDTISNFIDAHCEDNKLEYVIATHAHEDHIAGFGGRNQDGLLYKYDVGTIIEFAKTDSDSVVYNNYVSGRNYAKSKGTKVYTALEAYNTPSLKRITLGEDMYMETLYQKFYENKSSKENNYSVCTIFSFKNHNFLFTGDLEKEGENSLVESNSIPECELYKAGHHGSNTSSNEALMAAAKPKTVCACACAGSNEYSSEILNQFPTQEFINRVAPYTDKIYVTTISLDNSNKTFTSMNGIINFKSDGFTYSVNCSNNNTILKETAWFKANRTWPTI